jgi:hypothetical protein
VDISSAKSSLECLRNMIETKQALPSRKQGHELQLRNYSTEASDIILDDPETMVPKPKVRWTSERILL